MKVDSKTKTVLDDYKKKKRQELAKKAANDTTAFKFIYEDDEDDEDNEQKKGNSTEGEGKVSSSTEHAVTIHVVQDTLNSSIYVCLFVCFFEEKIR